MKLQSRILKQCCILSLVFFAFSGCSTPQKTRSLAMGLGFLAGSIVGSATAPSNERRELHAVYWGGIAGISAGLVANYMYDDSAQIQKLELETQNLKNELKLMENAKMIQKKEGHGKFQNSVPGNWKLYEVDRWNKNSPYRLEHVDQVIEIDPEKKPE